MSGHEGSTSHIIEITNEVRKVNGINFVQGPVAISNAGLWYARDAERNSEVLYIFGGACKELHKNDSV